MVLYDLNCKKYWYVFYNIQTKTDKNIKYTFLFIFFGDKENIYFRTQVAKLYCMIPTSQQLVAFPLITRSTSKDITNSVVVCVSMQDAGLVNEVNQSMVKLMAGYK